MYFSKAKSNEYIGLEKTMKIYWKFNEIDWTYSNELVGQI